jgi:flagellar protein FlgJ
VDIDSLGALHFNSQLLNDSIVNRAKNDASSLSGFEEMLKKTAMSDSHPQSPIPDPRSPSAKIDKTDKLYEQCLALETFLIKNLISSMRNTVQKTGLIDEGFAGKMYEDMLYDEYAKEFAKNPNFGFAEQAYLELSGRNGRLIDIANNSLLVS